MSNDFNEQYEALLHEVDSYRQRYKNDKAILERRMHYSSLEELEKHLKPSQFDIDLNGWHFECLYQRGENLGETLYVMLNGMRTLKTSFRGFTRWSYFGLCSGTMLNIDDPMIYKYKDMLLGWMYGDENTSVADLAVQIVKAVCQHEGRSYKNVIFFGSSGGGYDAIYCAALLPGSLSVCLNPQILLKNYPYSKNFMEMTGIDLCGKDRFSRNNLIPVIRDSQSKHVILANNNSRPDLVGHILPLCEALGIEPCFGLVQKENVLLWLYDIPATNARPHSSVESKHNFDFLIYIGSKFNRGSLSDDDKFLVYSMGELWYEKNIYHKKTVEDHELLVSFIGLSLKIIPKQDKYKPGEHIRIEVCSPYMNLKGLNFAWWVYCDNKIMKKNKWQMDSFLDLTIPPPNKDCFSTSNTYVVRCYLKNKDGKTFFQNSDKILVVT